LARNQNEAEKMNRNRKPSATMPRKAQNIGATLGMVSFTARLICSGVASTTLLRVLLQQQAVAQVLLELVELGARLGRLVAGLQARQRGIGGMPLRMRTSCSASGP
jgi:L-fucose isomerase-like protein